jgi:hypothetical protein
MVMEMDDKLPDFEGKTVLTYVDYAKGEEIGTTLLSPWFEMQGGRLFLVGESAPSRSPRWDDGAQMAVAWEQVKIYLVFDSLDELLAREAMSE